MAAEKGHKKWGGRRKGTPNKATREVRTLARQYGLEVIEKLAKLMRGQDKRLARLEARIDKLPADSEEMGDLLRQLLAVLSERNLQNVNVQLLLAHDLLQPRVLRFQLLQTLGF